MKAAGIAAALVLYALVAGCGMYGPLYLEEEPPEPTAPPIAVETPEDEDEPDPEPRDRDEGATAGGS